MEKRICNEYTVGFCTKQAFFDPALTQKCKSIHDSASKSSYDDRSFYNFEIEVYKTYKLILKEVDRNISNKEKMISLLNDYEFEENDKEVLRNQKEIYDKVIDERITVTSNDISDKNVGNKSKFYFKSEQVLTTIDRIKEKYLRNMKNNVYDYEIQIIYGKLINLLSNCKPAPSKFYVCTVCLTLIAKNEMCDYPFHNKFHTLRKLTEKRKKRRKKLKFK